MPISEPQSDDARSILKAAIVSGDLQLIADVARAHAWTLIVDDHDLLLQALALLPTERLEKLDLLRFVHPKAATLARANVQSIPEDDEQNLGYDGMTHMQVSESLAARMIARRLQGDVVSAVGLAARLEERMMAGRNSVQAADSRVVSHLLFQAGFTYLLAGRLDKAVHTLSTARQLAEFDEGNHVQRDAAAKLAIAHAFKGSIPLAEQDLASSRSLPYAPSFFASFMEISERTADALIQVERVSVQAEARVMALEPFNSPDELWPFMVLARARFELVRANPVDALDAVNLAFKTHPWQAGTIADDIRIAMSSDALLALGEVGSASTLCRELPADMALSRLSRTRVLVQSGDLAQAARECRALSGSTTTPAAVRDEAIVMYAWATVAAGGAIEASHARAIVRIATTGHRRRIITMVPGSVIDRIVGSLTESEAALFREAIADLVPAAEPLARPKLTPGEQKVLGMLTENITTAQLAELLFLSPNTVKTQLASVYRKLGVSNRTDAIVQATRMNLHD